LEQLDVNLPKLRTEIIRALGENTKVNSDSNANRSKSPTLDEFGTNLTQKALDGKLDPVVGREKEIERVIQILGRRTKNNPVLIGEPGVGKTAIAEGLAQRIANRDVPDTLEGKLVVALDIGLLIAGTKYRGEFEERLKRIMEEVSTSGEIILVIDEVHTLIGAGAAEGAIDAANILKPALSRGELQCIGATTIEEYRKHIEKDAALERRFQPVMVNEPSVDETIEILFGLRDLMNDTIN
jgi:ATP-dependent Clp protease ATP-binding subunit ClpC